MKCTTMILLSLVASVKFSYSQSVKTSTMKNVTEFNVTIPQSDLDDLKARLKNIRWPGEAPGSDWAFGTSEAYLKKLVSYWTTTYDWRKQEAALNKYPQ